MIYLVRVSAREGRSNWGRKEELFLVVRDQEKGVVTAVLSIARILLGDYSTIATHDADVSRLPPSKATPRTKSGG